MRPRSSTIRRLAVAVAAISFCLSVQYPASVEAQTIDLVTQALHALDADKVDTALAMLERAVRANPNDPAALAWLGGVQARKARTVAASDCAGWLKRGFKTLDEAVVRFPNAALVYFVRGMTASQVPDFFETAQVAAKDLSAVVAMKEKNPKGLPDSVMPLVYLELGLAYKKNHQPAEARSVWEKGKALYPSALETRAAMEDELENL